MPLYWIPLTCNTVKRCVTMLVYVIKYFTSFLVDYVSTLQETLYACHRRWKLVAGDGTKYWYGRVKDIYHYLIRVIWGRGQFPPPIW